MAKYKFPLDENFFIRFFHLHAFAHLIQSFFRPITRKSIIILAEDFYDLRDKYKP